MSPKKTDYQKETTTEKLKHPLSKENLIFVGILILVACILIITGIIKYNRAQERTIYAKASTVLANNVCPGCGQWGIPSCPYCRFTMQWNSAQRSYSCPRCRMQGAPYCPLCMRPAPLQSPGAIGCIPQNSGFTPQYTQPQQNGASLVA